MSVSFSKTECGRGIGLTRIYDDKFKSVCSYIFFVTKIDKHNIASNSLISKLLITSNSKIKSRTAFNKELMRLYGSSIAVASTRAGDYQMIGLCASCLCDKFTIGGEQISGKVTDMMLDCLFSPDIDENGFNEKYFKMRKQDVIDAVKASVNDKRGYALIKARKEIYKGEPSENSAYGELDEALKLENKALVEEYRKLLKSARVEIIVAGHSDAEKNVSKILDAFDKIPRDEIADIDYRAFSPLKPEPAAFEEKIDVNQTKLVMAFKTGYDDIYVNKLMIMLFGGAPFSKLFMNVREKLSLCYYRAAGFADTKNVMIVDSGMERENCERAKEEILAQLDAIAKGDFTDEELDNTKLALCTGFKSNNDTVSDMAAWYLTQFTRNELCSPEEICERLLCVTREQIAEAAKAMRLDTVYVVSPAEETEEENEN
ncbi:MAG: insulinase family protein [Ruminococcus sp.]|nr:insulinase family protein [Ruminococcus sp.]